MAEEEIEIQELNEPELDDEGQEIVKVEKPAIVTPEDGIAALQKQLDQAHEEKRQALARAQKAESEAFTYQADNTDTNIKLLANSAAEKERENKILQAALAEASEAGDHGRIAEIIVAMNENTSLISKFTEAKTHFEKQKETLAPPRRSNPTLDEFASTLPNKSASWIRAHPEYYTDPKLNSKLVSAHNFATADHEYESPEYFATIERMLGVNKPETQVKETESALSSAAHEAPVVAPVARGGNGKNVVTLSRAEREMAETMGMTAAEYAKNKIALVKEGKLTTQH